MSQINETAGQADPYWYEWFVGLIEVVKLLNSDDDVETVAFQVSSIKVWDDVVVHLKSGARRCYQAKHSRANKNLTFGSLVQKDQDGKTLLGSLFDGQQTSSLNDSSTSLILYTNRIDGRNWARLENGNRRPPLIEFWQWLKGNANEANAFSEFSVPEQYASGWQEWISCIDLSNETAAIDFFRQLEIRTREDDLDGLERRIRESLATAFGISREKAAPLFDALTRALREWTTGHPGVTVEILSDALTVPPETKELAAAPPPPTPFFPSRIPVAEDLEHDLLREDTCPTVFLTGEPGSGKTSAVSWLANRRSEGAFEGIIGLRFFCFNPIRPDQPFIDPDASRVKPEELWLSLLSQLRLGLKGRLHELRVPLRNTFLTWQEAREHVIRLADRLGEQLGRRFVISIDGIDHAARAAQIMPEQIADFFSSLPSPDELTSKNIRLLIAGQPPAYYSEQYPSWLQGEHAKVDRRDLPQLENADIRTLLENSATRIPEEQYDEGARLIDSLAQGNTLAIVFAVAESEDFHSLDELKSVLEQRRLSTGLEAYYGSIWDHALGSAKSVSCFLAGAISLARRPLPPEQLASAFTDWDKPIAWWREILCNLGPILVESEGGFQIRHNDVRVFLVAKFKSFPQIRRESVCSALATYFQSPDADRISAHLQLFNLLAESRRSPEMADAYDVDWVIEGAVLGMDLAQIRAEGDLAAHSLSDAKSWAKVVSVACGLNTLSRLTEEAEAYPDAVPHTVELPPFLPSEASVRPVSQWSRVGFQQLVWDAMTLVDAAEPNRAVGLLNRWLGELSLNQIADALPDIGAEIGFGDDGTKRLDRMVAPDFENLGYLSGTLNWKIEFVRTSETPRIELDAALAFEKGFVNSVTVAPTATSLEHLFALHKPVFLRNVELAVRNLVKSENWSLVGEVLSHLHDDPLPRLSTEFLGEATWFALRSGVHVNAPNWLATLDQQDYGLSATTNHSIHNVPSDHASHLNTSRALGWTRLGFDPAEIADSVLGIFAPFDDFDHEADFQLLFEANAVLGRIEGLRSSREWSDVAREVSSNRISQLLTMLWSKAWRSGIHQSAAKTAAELAKYCEHLGEEFENAALNVALPLARQHVLGPRRHAIWDTVQRNGRLDVLREWTAYYLNAQGKVWSWSHHELRETVDELAPLAKSIGQHELAEYASRRASWMRVSYREHKEYSFYEVFRWFQKGAENDPSIWSTLGWQLWQLCDICDGMGGDNRLASEISVGICAAAIRCGASNWWQLISTTLEESNNRSWHYDTRTRFVDGTCIALEQSADVQDDDILTMWSVALSLSYWFNDSDNASLQRMRRLLIDQASQDRKVTFERSMQSIGVVNVVEDATDHPPVSQHPNEEVTQSQTASRTDDDFWRELDETVAELSANERRWVYHDKLFDIARERAFLHGNAEILDGIRIQLDMHARWAFGSGELNEIAWEDLPTASSSATWESIAVSLLDILLNSYCAETLGAALEGLHALVDHNPDVIEVLFETITSHWAKRWLLNAAELWAVLHPNAIAVVRQNLLETMEQADLESRLQAWIIVSRNCDTLNEVPIQFPIPDVPSLTQDQVERSDTSLLQIPPEVQGHVTFANKYSAAQSMLKYFETFGFMFSPLEGLVADALANHQEDGNPPLNERGPHRHDGFYCVPCDTEIAVGHAIEQILGANWCTQDCIANLSAAFLSNEDPWIYRSRPRSLTAIEDWPTENEYGSGTIDTTTRRNRMLTAATTASLPEGWQVFIARAIDFSSREDFELSYWLEEVGDEMLITPASLPTCPGGRSFIWWIGEPVELNFNKFVSGLFVGGRQRLCHSNFEIRPPTAWRELFDWQPNPTNPLEWLFDGVPVARYERIHGKLRENVHQPKYRQPLINRWIITHEAFETVETVVGQIRERSKFDVARFK